LKFWIAATVVAIRLFLLLKETKCGALFKKSVFFVYVNSNFEVPFLTID